MNALEELGVDTEKLKEFLSIIAKAYTGKTPVMVLKVRDQMAMAQLYVQLLILEKLEEIEQQLT